MRLDFHYLSHVRLARHHQLVVEHALDRWLVLEQTGRWMNIDSVMRLQCPVRVATLLERSLKTMSVLYRDDVDNTHSVVEVARRDCLLHWGDIIGIWIRLNHHLHTVTQPSQLISNVARPAQTLELQKLLIAELLRIVRFGPLFPNIQQSKVIASSTNEILPRLICVQFLVFRSVK